MAVLLMCVFKPTMWNQIVFLSRNVSAKRQKIQVVGDQRITEANRCPLILSTKKET